MCGTVFTRWLLPDDFSLPGKEFFQVEFIAVKDAVGEIADPVSQADYPAVISDRDIIGDMPVTEYKVFYFRMFSMFLTGKLDLVFIFRTKEGAKGSVFHPAFGRPPVCKCHGSVGMNPGIKPLNGPVFKDSLEHLVRMIAPIQAITMSQKEGMFVPLPPDIFPVHLQVNF